VALPEGMENAIKLTQKGQGYAREKVRLIADRVAQEIANAGFVPVLPASPGAIAAGDWKGLSFVVYDIYHVLDESTAGDLAMLEAIKSEGKQFWFGTAQSFNSLTAPMIRAKMLRKVAGIKTEADYGFVHTTNWEDFGSLGETMRDINSTRRMAGDENLADWKRAKRER